MDPVTAPMYPVRSAPQAMETKLESIASGAVRVADKVRTCRHPLAEGSGKQVMWPPTSFLSAM